MKNVVICGGGIMGCSTAYFLSLKGVKATVVDRCEIACAASGKAGGFLAKDWCDHSELGTLARTSFDLHMSLAEQFSLCDYRRVETLSVTLREGKPPQKKADLPEWIDGPVVNSSRLGTTANTAQVHPFKLTNTFMDEAKRLVGSDVVIGTVQDVEQSHGKVTGVKVNGKVLPADVVIITMGPWTFQAAEWLPMPIIRGGRAHSIVIRPPNDVTAHCLFTDYSSAGLHGVELYPRPDGTVYACGFSDGVQIPNDPREIKPNPQSCDTLKKLCNKISSNLADAAVESAQACYLPTPGGHLPVIGKIPNIEGAYMAAGHTCWGILNAPATGKALAELIVDGECSFIDLTPFDPTKFM